ncbi:MAG: Zn-ribbon domain-containing OB-fold protein [Trebonia sp.]
MNHVSDTQLRAPMEITFDYTRSLGPVLGQFMTALRERRILGARGADGRVHAPPFEYDPVTFRPPADLVEVGPAGTVMSWSWLPSPLDGQPLDRPFGWALIRLDGADTAMLHAVDAGSAAAMRTGMRVTARWAADRVGSIRDIACFEPSSGPPASERPAGRASAGGDPVTMTVAPVRLRYEHTASPAETAYLRGLAQGRLVGQRCPACGKVYIPSRGTCPADGVSTDTEIELPDTGTVTTFSIVNVGYPGQQVTPPYVAALVLLDGADIAFQHLILGCDPGEVRMGMRVRAAWRPPEERGTAADSISHFAPSGEPDAPYESYARFI